MTSISLPYAPATNARRPFERRSLFAVLGLACIAGCATLLTAGVAVLSSEPGVLGFTIPLFTVAVALAAWNLARPARAAAIAAGAGGLAAAALVAPHVAAEAKSVDSFFDFMPVVLAVAGSALAIAAGAAAVAGRGAVATSRASVVRVSGAVALAAVALAGISAGVTLASRTSVSDAEAAGAQPVKIANVDFAPARVTVAAGQAARFVVSNSDPVAHTFRVKAANVDVRVGPGSEKLVELPALAAGTYEITCSVPGHERMSSELIVAP